ncbi:chemotaxis protein CheB [Umezawaea endophytica]|uniref:protein-glutamate methylesterase n=1 Tax=Umezawaea endophytica TaxID=1654476 RepID=A0A9X2VR48_9PSEU|nr:chemotaxis protein CheB [Umezawaea endophytica]MCS7481338.1 chemotaxis protein CheB [Umezawaea endophytica]
MALEPRDLVVVGASAGGVEALRNFVSGLPLGLPAAVVVVLHLPAGGNSALPAILARSGLLPAVSARHGMELEHGLIHVAPPDHHVVVDDGVLTLSRGPTENGHRPAVDALFRSASLARGPRVIGVVLSGALDDGTAGMVAISARGGVTMAQDLGDALYRGMPGSVMRHVRMDHVLPARLLGSAVRRHAGELVETDGLPAPPALLRMETLFAVQKTVEVNDLGEPSGFSCPDCSGTLVELDAERKRFRCRVGHAWTADALLDAQAGTLERALWTALRTLEEKVSLARKLRMDARKRGGERLAERYARTEEESAHAAGVLRGYLLSDAVGEQAHANRFS